MMKEEFEKLIGKEVSFDTFSMYEAMYNALPENVNKQQFVKMLNIDAIPEDHEAIERRQERERFVSDIKDQIAGKKSDIKYFKQENERYHRYITEEESKECIKLYRNWIRGNNRYIEKLRAELKDYPNRWCFRVVRPSNHYFTNTAWIPCITYLDDNDKFQHMVWKDVVRMSNGIGVTLRKYSGDDTLIEICGNPSSGNPSNGFNHTFPIYITYNETSHKADVIKDPKQQVMDISAMLTAMGFPLPKKYYTKLKNNKPFNFQYAQPMRRFTVSCNDYMNESCLED